jgi:ribosomal protein S18 acetylase RimI-like enzyme
MAVVPLLWWPTMKKSGTVLPDALTDASDSVDVDMRQILGMVLREVSLAETRALRLAAGEPAGAFAVGVFDRAELIAVGFVVPEGEPGAWRVRGMATAPHARGKGAGTAVLDALLRHAIAGGAVRVWCNVRTPARSLYERAGFRAISEQFELPHIGPHVVMERRTAGAARVALGDVPRSDK